MRILLVNTYHYRRGGDCTYTFALAELLRSKGHEVFFFGMKHPLNVPCPEEKYFVDYIDYRELNQKRDLNNGLKVVTRSIYSIQAQTRLRALLLEIRPDIAHLQNIHSHLTPSVIFELKKHNIPMVWTLHDFKLICPNTHLLSHGNICESCKGRKFYYCTLKKCKNKSYAASAVATVEAIVHCFLKVTKHIDAFISPSEFLKRKFIEFGFGAERFYQINNFLADDSRPSSHPMDDGYALYFGQIEPWKGLRTLMRAWSDIQNIELYLAGDGSIRNELEKDAVGLNVKFLGYLQKEALFKVLSRAGVIIMPSECYENYPYSVMESMAFGKPVIASNIGGLPELVVDNETGFLFDHGDSIVLKQKIDLLINDSKKRQTLGMKAMERAGQLFSPDLHYTKLMNVYENVLLKHT